MLRWPHGGHGDCASARAGYGVHQWARPAGTRVGGRFTALQRHQRCCRFEAFTVVPWKVLRRPTEARKPKTQVMPKNAVTHALRGQKHAGRPCPTPGGCYGRHFGRSVTKLRIYGFTPLPPPPTLRPGHAHLRIKLPWYRRTVRVLNLQLHAIMCIVNRMSSPYGGDVCLRVLSRFAFRKTLFCIALFSLCHTLLSHTAHSESTALVFRTGTRHPTRLASSTQPLNGA